MDRNVKTAVDYERDRKELASMFGGKENIDVDK